MSKPDDESHEGRTWHGQAQKTVFDVHPQATGFAQTPERVQHMKAIKHTDLATDCTDGHFLKMNGHLPFCGLNVDQVLFRGQGQLGLDVKIPCHRLGSKTLHGF